MKKVKLLGIGALAAFLLAGCNIGGGGGGGKSTTKIDPTSEPSKTSAPTSAPSDSSSSQPSSSVDPSSSQPSSSVDPSSSSAPSSSSEPPAPSKEAWTAEESEFIQSALSDDEYAFAGDLPFAHGLTVDDEEQSYVRAVGDVVSDDDVTAYGDSLGADFELLDFVPEDIVLLEAFEDDQASVYAYDYSGGYIMPAPQCMVAVGKEAGTGKLLVCATLTYCGMPDADLNFDTGSIQYYSAEAAIYVSYYASYIPFENGYPYSIPEQADYDVNGDGQLDDEEYAAWLSAAQAAYNAAAAEAADYYVLPEFSCDGVAFNDNQFMNPFTYGNVYSQYYWASTNVFYLFTDSAEYATWISNVEAAGYVQLEGDDDWIYAKEVEGVGTFLIGSNYMEGALGTGDICQVYLDFEAASEEAA